MKMPIGLNRSRVPTPLRRFLPDRVDPRLVLKYAIDDVAYTEAVSVFKIGTTFKTTEWERYPKTNRTLAQLRTAASPVVLDVGASDGSAALGLMEVIKFRRYYVTDRNLFVYAQPTGRGVLFSDSESRPVLYANDWIIVYANVEGAIWPLGRVSHRLISRAVAGAGKLTSVELLNPRLRAINDPRVVVQSYDVFTAWPNEKADIVVAANLFNRSYFSDAKIRAGLYNLRDALKDGGVLAVIENRAEEQATLFRLRGRRFVVETEVGSGSDICQLVRDL